MFSPILSPLSLPLWDPSVASETLAPLASESVIYLNEFFDHMIELIAFGTVLTSSKTIIDKAGEMINGGVASTHDMTLIFR
jgi:hypothetical protein